MRCLRRGDFVFITLEADSFLYKMARIIVASLLRVAKGEWDPCQLKQLLASRERKAAPAPAPPQGLCLVSVAY